MSTEGRRARPVQQGEGHRRRIEARVRRYAAERGLWPDERHIVVAVSGGPDSSALLLVLARILGDGDCGLTAAYFDHGLRGPVAAAAERAAVERLAAMIGARLACGSGDVRDLARSGKHPLEEAARRARYGFLAATAESLGCRTVAVGHTADDQAETVLMHLVRGAGMGGMAGMAPLSRWPAPGHGGLRLVRPLLALSRKDTLSYCEAAGFEPVDDASNRSPAFLRNRLRLEVLPLLRRLNPRVDAALTRLADAARADMEVLEAAAGGAVQEHDGSVLLDRAALRAWAPSLRGHAFRLALLVLLGDLQGFSARHLVDLARVCSGRTGARLDLPRGVTALVHRDAVELRVGAAPRPAALPSSPVTLAVPGEASIGHWRVAAGHAPVTGAAWSATISARAAGEKLVLRRRRNGDRFQPLGMSGTKKLQDYFVDAAVPREERDAVVVIEAEAGIVCLAGHRIAEWARPKTGDAAVHLALMPAPPAPG